MAGTGAFDPMILEGVLILPASSDAPSSLAYPQVLHRILAQCATAYLAGVRRVLVQDPDGAHEGATATAWFNQLLASRGLDQMAVRAVEPGSAQERNILAAREERHRVAARRHMLTPEANTTAAHPLATVLEVGRQSPGALFACSPMISAIDCTGCDACLNACPHTVLTQINDRAGQPHYHADPVACDACGLCADVCSSGAIEVLTMVNAPVDIPLRAWVCSDCGAPAHVPEQRGKQGGQCRVCAETGHHKKLFQVLT